METDNLQTTEGSGSDAPTCSVTPFDHKTLHLHFEGLREVTRDHDRGIYLYLVKSDVGWVDQIVFLSQWEMRIHVDNFPAQKMGFSSNLPIRTMEEFQRDVERCGIKLIRSQNAEVSHGDGSATPTTLKP